MQLEINRLTKKIEEISDEIFAFYAKLDPQKNQTSRDQILQAKLKMMEATTILHRLLEKIEKAKAKKESEK